MVLHITDTLIVVTYGLQFIGNTELFIRFDATLPLSVDKMLGTKKYRHFAFCFIVARDKLFVTCLDVLFIWSLFIQIILFVRHCYCEVSVPITKLNLLLRRN